MAKLTDYLDARTLQQLQDMFSAVAEAPVRILGPQGEPLTEPSGSAAPQASAQQACQAMVAIGEETVGRLEVMLPAGQDDAPARRCQASLRLMANVLSRLWDREKELRSRVEELATLYRLSAEFTGQRDLQTVLDLVTKTVVDVLKAKACSIRLLNDERTELVMKAVHNLSQEYLGKGPILISQSKIDEEVLSTGRMVYIADERTDGRVLYPAEARQEGIVSALCAPMSYKGRPEGVIRVYMAELHEFDWFEASLLHAIAAEAAAAIVNARLYQEAVQSANMRRALQMAAEVQRRMIPARPPQIAGLQFGAIYVPTYELGGDFFDFIPLPRDNIGVAICDVAGKGVRASLLMASIRAALRAHATNIYDMSQVLARVNRDLCADTQVSDFATLFYGVIDMRAKRFTFSNAGHLPPVLYRQGATRELTAGGGILGIDPNMAWEHDSFIFRPGDALLAYTDGLSDAMNFADESFGRKRVEAAAGSAIGQGQPAEAVAKHVLWEMRRFSGLQTRTDDVTILVIKVL